jgi:hypothetical protein
MHDHWAAISLLAVTAAVSLLLTILAAAAWNRTGNRKLVPVMLAFWIFFAKSALTLYSLHTDFLHHEDLELVGGLFDLAIVALLFAPFIPLRRTA